MSPESYQLFKIIHASEGMKYFNRQKVRLFTVNIFKGNLAELQKACGYIENPEIGLKLMSEALQGPGVQVHMEVNRYFHNFLASAKSLIDHTRVFVEDYYKNTAIEQAYKQKISSELASDPVSRFIQDLRNYMVHKALPNSSMSLTVSRIENSSAHDLVTTVSISRDNLLKWSKWSSVSKEYLRSTEERIKISELSKVYGDKILEFYGWFDAKLEKHHKKDIDEFHKLNKQYQAMLEQENSSK